MLSEALTVQSMRNPAHTMPELMEIQEATGQAKGAVAGTIGLPISLDHAALRVHKPHQRDDKQKDR